MAHLEIHKTVGAFTNVYAPASVSNIDTLCRNVVRTQTHAASIGDVTYYDQCKTMKAPLKNGWRSPTVFWGDVLHRVRPPIDVEVTLPPSYPHCGNRVYRGLATPIFSDWSTDVGPAISGLPTGYTGLCTSALVYEAEMKALTALGESKVDLSLAFKERKETAAFVVSQVKRLDTIAGRISGRIRSRRRPRPLSPSAAIDAFGQRWLEYRYAWQPLVADVYGAVEAIERSDNGTFDRYIIRSRKVAKSTLQGTKPYGGVLTRVAGYTLNTSRHYRYSDVSGAKVCIYADLTNATYRRMMDVGVTNPATTLWESLPYSFIVDWFLGVGDYITAVNAFSGLKFRGGTVTRFRKYSADAYVTFDGDINGRSYQVFSRDDSYFDRRLYIVPPAVRLLRKRDPINATRLLDVFAMFGKRFGRVISKFF